PPSLALPLLLLLLRRAGAVDDEVLAQGGAVLLPRDDREGVGALLLPEGLVEPDVEEPVLVAVDLDALVPLGEGPHLLGAVVPPPLDLDALDVGGVHAEPEVVDPPGGVQVLAAGGDLPLVPLLPGVGPGAPPLQRDELPDGIGGDGLGAVEEVALLVLGVLYAIQGQDAAWALYAIIVLSLVLGVLGVLPIGGGDMPVIIAFLNSFSGLAGAAAGFVILNKVLIVAGCLVGTSGIILTIIMCKAMNRTFGNVLFGGFGAAGGPAGKAVEGEMKGVSIEDAYYVLEAAQNVVFVPGYGMAVAQAQHAVKELGALLERNGAEVRFAIHPVAGRMPGHMNVLLAEADVPYEQLCEMDAVNPTMGQVDVAMIIGANDVVNPAAADDPSSPIYGMPIINAHEARTVFALKRGKGSGFSGLENALFFRENCRMIYGDAKETITGLVAQFKG
ncbi:MAG: NAD(P)(+) transhydrogenase (Re/Si-specific) subunit beta, partial [Planctomycetaceae bacterium]|nr:NAD(P)(+) transhydrogenase (Re/Si-specific) subunit beta [Planctomycetaceae bacterium]